MRNSLQLPRRIFYVLISGVLFLIAPQKVHAQLTVTPGVSAATLIANLVGAGVTVNNVVINCPANAYGTFANGNTTNLGITNGILLTTGSAVNAIGPNNSTSAGTCNGTSSNDPQLTSLDPTATHDPCIIEFDITPACSNLQIRFVFGSEEYPEFVNASFNDAFGLWVTGPTSGSCPGGTYNNQNMATLPNNTTIVSIDNVSPTTNSAYYVDNTGGATIQYDGFTTVLTRNIAMCPCLTYHWKLGIADASDCIYDSGVFIDFLACSNALTITPSQVNTTCSGCTGSATVTLSGGTGPFTYNWSPAPGGGQGTATATGLCAGTYTCTINDGISCTPPLTQTFTITSGGSLTVSGSQTNIVCAGSCTGSATTTIVAGTGPFTYSWAPSGGSSATASGLCAGTYTCTVTASGGCTATQTFNITANPPITNTSSQVNLTCNGVCNGSATVVASGGTGTYTYAWAPSGGTGATASGLCAGTYTCTISSPAGCTHTQTFNITQPPAITLTPSQVNVTCNGACTGSATVVAAGGNGTYTYSWAPSGGTGATASSLCAGTYTVTVSSPAGCTATQSFNITQPPAITNTSSQVNVTCFGACNGSATVVASGGTGTYTYAWAPSGGTGATASGLCAGTYTCTISSPAGCTHTQTFNITQPPAITLTPSQVNVTCNGACNGSATVVAAGGNGTYTYAWAPSGGTGATASSLCAGTYTVTVSSPAGCTATQSFNITQPPAITLTPSQVNVTCNGACNGSATVVAAGGNGTYTYSWAPSGGSAATASSLCAGTYTVTVSSPAGCTATQSFNITQPPVITNTSSQVNVTCFGACNGSATVVASGGTGTYTYSWAPSGGTGATASGLCAGTYTCTISSPAGCTHTQTFNITQPPAITLTPSQVNVTCNGVCNGSATVVAAGGNGTYTYAWAPSGGTGATASSLCAGTYTVTVSSPAGCTATQSFNITQPPAITLTPSQVNVTCNGACNGSATVVAAGGNGTYTYSWAPSGGSSATASSLCAGSYTVSVSSPAGCTVTQTFNITQPTALTATQSFVPATCGGNNGSATVTPSGGTGPYTYSWAPVGGNSATASSLTAGSYTCTITDSHGCVTTNTVVVTSTGSVTASITATVNVTCFGGNNGSATVTPAGGASPYTYAWSPSGGTSATGTSLTAGSYTCTVTDANGCVASATVMITQPPAITNTSSQINVTCNGSCNGSATVVASGGTGTYTYAWTPSGGTGATASSLCAGTYTCTISSPAGCTHTQTFSITQPSALTATQSQVNVNCNGSCNGSASVVASGGVGPYTYSWSPSGGSAATASSLCAGSYTCTITDANGCSITSTFNITQPTAITATTSSVPTTCGNFNGSATVTPSGGVGPYTYSWAPTGGTSSTAPSLGPGTYTCTITDANLCTFTITVIVGNAGSPAANITASTNTTCSTACNGSATVAGTGGTLPYTYNWSPSGGTSATANSLCPGTYTATVTDANGCFNSATVTITSPPAITITPSQVNVTCNGSCNGSATVVAAGGNGTYTYSWAPSGGTGSTASGLCAGTYTCTVSSPAGCTATQTFNITQPTALTASATSTPVLCNGGSTGTATVTAGGGTGPYTYSWSPSGGTGSTAGGLNANTYTCTVTDANGCTVTATTTVAQPTALSASTSITSATCGSANGSATVTVTGGTGPYTYSWSPSGGTGSSATGLLANIYTVTVTDANSCTVSATANVPNAGSPTVTITSSVNVSCNGGNDGSATSSVSGGSSPYTYAWSPSGGTGATGTGMIAGSYTVTVTDANGCTANATVSITQPPVITITPSQVNVTCNGACNGSATVVAAGGNGTYTYSWAPSGGTGSTASGLCAGTYTCTVSSPAGCTATQTFNITQPTALTASATSTPVLCNGGSTGTATVSAGGGTGPYTYSWSPSGGTGSTAGGLNANTYTCTVTDANGCTVTATTTVTEPTALSATTAFTSATCGNANGSATVTVTGGTGPYTYSWSPSGGTGSSATGLLANIYTVTVTDANSCTVSATANVPNAGSPTVTITSSVNVSCNGGSDGSATSSVSGGSSPYTYAWTPSGGTGSTGTGMIAGNYTVTVTDANGCTATATVLITEPPALTASATITPVLCNGGNTGTATVTAGGGTPNYTYSWSPSGGTGSTAPGLTAQGYTCTVTDVNGCTVTAVANVTEPTAITTTASQVDESCNGGNTGSATVNPSGGTGPYTYSWSPSGGNAATANNLTATGYTCTITDANGCTLTQPFTITEPSALVLTTSFTQATCGGSNGSATVNISGGTSPYTQSWSPIGGTGTTANGIPAGSYTVTVTDSKGCTATATVNVPNAGSPTVSVTTVTNVLCNGGNNGSITVSASGGTTPYTYSWSPSGGTGSTESNLTAGNYTCTLTDANGCIDTASATVTEPPALTISGSSVDVLCFGNATGSASVTVSGGAPAYTYNWSPSGGTGSSANVLTAGTYTCDVTDANGCTISQAETITEPPQLTLAVAGFNVTCFNSCDGQVVVIPSGGTPNYTFAWNTGCNSPSCNNICAGSYTVDVTDANGCIATASTTVTQPTAISITTSEVDAHCNQTDGSASANATGGTGVLTYQWISGPSGQNNNNIAPGTYSVIVTDANSCADTATVTVNNLNGVNGSLGPVVDLSCFGNASGSVSINAAGGNGPYSYAWTPNVSSTNAASNIAAGNYSVVVTDADGCTSTVTATVTEPTQVDITASSNPGAVCAGGSVSISCSGSGGTPGYTYSWNPGAMSGTPQTVSPATSTTYTAYVTDVNGCMDSTTVAVAIDPVPVSAFAGDILSGCSPICVQFTDQSTVSNPGQITGWSWDFGDGNTSFQQNPNHCYSDPGMYSVTLTITTADGCSNTIVMSNYIDVWANPVAGFTASPQPTTILDPIITFTDTSIGAVQWNWTFGDLNIPSSSLQNPVVTYNNADCYQVVLTVTSIEGCTDTASSEICIGPDATIYVPNAFTPNDDGVNDVFMPVGIGLDPDKFEMWIFDRWGNMIFYTDDLNYGWNGKVQGHEEVCQIDTYVWKIKAIDITGAKHNLIGKVSLIK